MGLAVRVHVGWTTSTRGTAEPLVLQSAFRPRFITQWLCVGHRVFTNSFCQRKRDVYCILGAIGLSNFYLDAVEVQESEATRAVR